MDHDQRLANPQLFAFWAGEDVEAWEHAVGTSITHISRGPGTVTSVSQDAGNIGIHVGYIQGVHEHPLWEFRTEITKMTLPAGLSRADLLPAARAHRIQQTIDRRDAQAARLLLAKQRLRSG